MAEFPDDTGGIQRLPYYSLNMENKSTYPSYEDYEFLCGKNNENELNRIHSLLDNLHESQQEENFRALGWADLIQNSIIADLKEKELDDFCPTEWILLLQANSIQSNEFELLFGDCGSIFLYINRKDLLERNFDNVRLVLQC